MRDEVDCCMSCAPAFAQVRLELLEATERADAAESLVAGRVRILETLQNRYNEACDTLRGLGFDPPDFDVRQVMRSTMDRWEQRP